MLIRSQNREKIVNLDNIDTIAISGRCEIVAYNGSPETETILGKYSEEKLILVLDMIESHYIGQCKVFQMPQENEIFM